MIFNICVVMLAGIALAVLCGIAEAIITVACKGE